ncbi:SEL1-like repeat protein [Candidatus Woesearchaeota archaeon]|nr:SEL1-like repeat protein [Candidatus Woesearchaeota archaeon]
MANAYFYGEGIDVDESKAFYWHNMASDQGLEEAQSQLDEIS